MEIMRRLERFVKATKEIKRTGNVAKDIHDAYESENLKQSGIDRDRIHHSGQ